MKPQVLTLSVLAVIIGCWKPSSSLIEQRPPTLGDVTVPPVIYADSVEVARDCTVESSAADEGNEGEGGNFPIYVRVYRIVGDREWLIGFDSGWAPTTGGIEDDEDVLLGVPTPWSMRPSLGEPDPDDGGCLAGVWRTHRHISDDETMTSKFGGESYCVSGMLKFYDNREDVCDGPERSSRVGPWADWEARRAAVARGEP
jgi:hypothetical protein